MVPWSVVGSPLARGRVPLAWGYILAQGASPGETKTEVENQA